MSVLSATHPTLVDRLLPGAGVLRHAGLAIAGTVLLTVSAKIQIPFWPVPFTMQTFAVLVIGMAFGRNLALGTVLLYFAEGAVGLPVFAQGGGIGYFVTAPSAGYLLGFAPSAYLVGALAERGWDRSVPTTLGAMILGTAVIFILGVLGLMRFATESGSVQTLIASGIFPYLPGTALKILLATALLPVIWKFVDRH